MSSENDPKKIAEGLRALADEVEKCKVRNYQIESSQFAKRTEFDIIDKVKYLRTGEMSIAISLSLYNPEQDDNRRIPEIIREEQQKRQQ